MKLTQLEIIFILFAVIIVKFILTIIISKSNIEMCQKTSNKGTEKNLNCTSKLVVSLSIENGKMNDTDYMEAIISKVNLANNTEKLLQNPFKISLGKSSVIAQYPCIYVQDFNFKPVEQIILSDVFSCNDGDLAPNPSCGWVYKDSKTSIPYSQGFCCKCDFSQIIGIDTTSLSRGSSCGLFNLGSGSATAHCLRFDNLWYSAYEVRKYIINYTIDISVIYSGNDTDTHGNNNDYTIEKISLSPTDTVSMTQSKKIIARLIGDFFPPTPPSDFSNFFLLIPSSPATHTMVKEGPLNWMLIPKLFFTMDGRECDKIGVGYYAFRSQGGSNGCKMKYGDCLHNQIYDFYIEDIKRLSQNQATKYLISQDKSISYQFYQNMDPNKKQFSYNLNGDFNSLITLEILADDIKFVMNVSSGQIDFINVQTFESLSNDGSIELQVTNSGEFNAQFSISYKCSEYILPIPGLTFSLIAFKSKTIVNNLYTLNQDFRDHLCNITLKNSLGEVTDNKIIRFNTTRVIKNNNQNFNITSTTEKSPINNSNFSDNSQFEVLNCNLLCPGLFDFLCFIVHDCWGYFARTCLVILAVIFGFVLTIKFIKNKCCCKIVDKFCNCFDQNNNKKTVKNTMRN